MIFAAADRFTQKNESFLIRFSVRITQPNADAGADESAGADAAEADGFPEDEQPASIVMALAAAAVFFQNCIVFPPCYGD